MKYEIDLNPTTINRIENLAAQERITVSEIIETLLNRHMRVVNTAVMESDNYIAFINRLGIEMQDDLGTMPLEDCDDEKMQKVFEALFAHTLENQIMLADLYEVFKKA